jgi:hypothetical protein
MNSFHSKNRLSFDVVKMVDEGADRDEIMIRVGMLLMLDQLDCASDISQASKLHEDGEGSSGNRILIRPIVEDAATTSLCN